MACDGPGYASAIYIQETSLILFNDRIQQKGEKCLPTISLRAIYPLEGTFIADYPYFALDARWVRPDQATAAQKFGSWLAKRMNPSYAARFGFRVRIGELNAKSPIDSAHGADPAPPSSRLDVPDSRVIEAVQKQWLQDRRPAEVVLAVDESQSMYRARTLDTIEKALPACLQRLLPEDRVALLSFGDRASEHVPLKPPDRALFDEAIRNLIPGEEEGRFWDSLDAVLRGGSRMIMSAGNPVRTRNILVLTDGIDDKSTSTAPTPLLQLAKDLHAMGIRVFFVVDRNRAYPRFMRAFEAIAQETLGTVNDSDVLNGGQVCHDIVSNF